VQLSGGQTAAGFCRQRLPGFAPRTDTGLTLTVPPDTLELHIYGPKPLPGLADNALTRAVAYRAVSRVHRFANKHILQGDGPLHFHLQAGASAGWPSLARLVCNPPFLLLTDPLCLGQIGMGAPSFLLACDAQRVWYGTCLQCKCYGPQCSPEISR